MTGKYAVEDKEAGTGSGYTVQLVGNFVPQMPDIFPKKTDGNYYDVPYKIMVPKTGVGANLLVPVALSASAVAYSSTRIEAFFMAVGSAAGVAAKQLVDGTAPTVQVSDSCCMHQVIRLLTH